MKKILVIGVLAICSTALCSCGKSAKQFNSTGIEYYNESEYEKAVDAFDEGGKR